MAQPLRSCWSCFYCQRSWSAAGGALRIDGIAVAQLEELFLSLTQLLCNWSCSCFYQLSCSPARGEATYICCQHRRSAAEKLSCRQHSCSAAGEAIPVANVAVLQLEKLFLLLTKLFCSWRTCSCCNRGCCATEELFYCQQRKSFSCCQRSCSAA